MIRARFHGRGGQGIKTAGRVLGTAAFLAEHECQDSPLYGAERRGAAVVAHARIADTPIRERGPIDAPDLILLADETLLDDPTAGVLLGQESASLIFLNTEPNAPSTRREEFHAPVLADDLSARTLAMLGRASALSAGLGAAAARLTGQVPWTALEQALREEFTELGLDEEDVTRNVELGRAVFHALEPVAITPRPRIRPDTLAVVGTVDARLASPTILEPGNAFARRTGTWRVERPVLDIEHCTRCGLCFARCPDGAITLDAQGYPAIDHDHCKGCMICQEICPVHALALEKETRAW